MTRVDAFTYGAEGEARKRLADLEKQARWARENRRRLKPKAKKDLRLLRVLFGRPSTFATDPEDDPIHPLCNTKPANDGNLYPYNSKLRPPPIWIDEDGVAIADQPKVVYDDSSSWPYTALDPRHVDYVARQPCLVCGGGPAHVYYLRFTEELARKVSDEYTVPLCGDHLDELRTVGDEAMWWMRTGVEPVGVARMLWRVTHPEVTAAQLRDPAEGRLMRSRRLAFYAALAANHAASVPPQPSNDKSAAPPAAC
jgi:hypothetical protein